MKVFIQFNIIYFLLLQQFQLCFTTTTPCNLRNSKYGSVCVCNSTYCDYLDDINPNEPNELILVSSTEGGLRFSKQKYEFGNFNDNVIISIADYGKDELTRWRTFVEPSVILRRKILSDGVKVNANIRSSHFEIKINRNIKYQKIVGFGGAFTGAVSYNLDKISKELQNHVYRSYFSKINGIGYNFLRMSIGGCDFDLEPWAYNELPKNDPQLSNFHKLDSRDIKKIEQIDELKKISNNYHIKLMGSTWSPPPWMKSNNDWTGLSSLKTEYYQTWADYHIRFLELMDARNISFWAITTGNEPLNGVIGWMFVRFMSLGWLPQNQGIWLGQNLGPSVRNSKFKNIKIFGNDDQRYTFPLWYKRMESKQTNSTSYLDGLAVHWYWDNIVSPSLLDQSHNIYPEKMILNTESCVGDKPFETHGPELGSWKRAEKYARYYIQDLQHWVNGWIDWNIVLDENGGPNYVNNHVDAPIIVNTTSGEEIYKQPIFYAIGHFSKFLPEGSVRIDSGEYKADLEYVAFERPDKNIVLVILNSKKTSTNLMISDSVRGQIMFEILPKSIHTIVYK